MQCREGDPVTFQTGIRLIEAKVCEIGPEMHPFVFTQNTQREANQGPEMDTMIIATVVLCHIVYLRMTVVTGGDDIIRFRRLNLVELDFTIGPPLLFPSGLQESATTAAAVIVGKVWRHIDEIFLADQLFQDVPHIFAGNVTVSLSHQLTGILQGEFDFQVLVPVRIDRKFPFPDPFGVFQTNI